MVADISSRYIVSFRPFLLFFPFPCLLKEKSSNEATREYRLYALSLPFPDFPEFRRHVRRECIWSTNERASADFQKGRKRKNKSYEK